MDNEMVNRSKLFTFIFFLTFSATSYSLSYCKIEFCSKDKDYCFHHDTAYPVDSVKKDPLKKKIRGTSRPSKCKKIAGRLRSVACRKKYTMTKLADESKTGRKTAVNVKWTAGKSIGLTKSGFQVCF